MTECRRRYGECNGNCRGVHRLKVPAMLATLLILGNGVLCDSSHASPSGLNNIPTTDTAEVHKLVLQGWTGFGREQNPDWWTGFKLGLVKGLEVGADWDADGHPSRHVQFQAKYGLDLNEEGTRVAVGVANVSDDQDRNGEPFPYAVLTQDVKGWFRVHVGYDFQKDNEGAFGGIDRAVGLVGRDVTLCADAIQVNDREDWLLAPGVKFGLGRKAAAGESLCELDNVLQHFVFETWVTFSTKDNAEESYVAKLNLVLDF
jgi:hypothetical protein